MRKLGFEVKEEGGRIDCSGRGQGKELHLAFPSVGATENILLAAIAIPGKTTLINAAREPEICDLAGFLRSAGARIAGDGSSVITVEGGYPLHGTEYRIMSDRIAAATYACAVACAGGRAELRGIEAEHTGSIFSLLENAGCGITVKRNCVTVERGERFSPFYAVKTTPYPGFPTDAQAILMATALKGKGLSAFTEMIFESRFRHVGEMKRMGADIRLFGHSALVYGVESIRGADVEAADLRGGAALMISALGAEGESKIHGIQYIRRGYEYPEKVLRELGADIEYLG